MQAQVMIDGETTDAFPVAHGVKQGCFPTSTLFTLFLAAALEVLNRDTTKGVYITTRSEGRLFNVSRLKAKTKVRQLGVRDILYADETGFVSHSEVDLQTIHDRFAAASASFGLFINVRKIEVLHQPAPGTSYTAPTILLKCSRLKVATTIANDCSFAIDCSLDKKMSVRFQSASAAFGRLRERLWNKHNIKLVTKCKVYRAIILSCLLYSSKMCTLYRRHIQRLSQIHLRHLRAISETGGQTG